MSSYSAVFISLSLTRDPGYRYKTHLSLVILLLHMSHSQSAGFLKITDAYPVLPISSQCSGLGF